MHLRSLPLIELGIARVCNESQNIAEEDNEFYTLEYGKTGQYYGLRVEIKKNGMAFRNLLM